MAISASSIREKKKHKKNKGRTVILLRRIGHVKKGEGSLLWTRFSLVLRSERGLITGVCQVCIVYTFFSVVSPKRNTVRMLWGYSVAGFNQVCFKTAPLILTKTLMYILHCLSLSKKIQFQLSLNIAYRQFIQRLPLLILLSWTGEIIFVADNPVQSGSNMHSYDGKLEISSISIFHCNLYLLWKKLAIEALDLFFYSVVKKLKRVSKPTLHNY